MNLTKTLSASVLTAGLLMSATACAPSNAKNNEPAPSPATSQSATQTATPSASPSESPSATPSAVATIDNSANEAEAVVSTVNDFYKFVADPENASKIEAAGVPLKGRGSVATDEELEALVMALPGGFKYFDTSTPDLIKNAYVQLIMGSALMSEGSIKASFPASAATVSGDTATVNANLIEVSVNGKMAPNPSMGTEQNIKLKRDAAGSWVMVADDSIEKALSEEVSK